MHNATEENCQIQTDTRDVRPIGGATIETLEGADGQTLVRFTFDGMSCTGTPAEFCQALADYYEETIVHTMDLPVGQDFVVFTDCNVVGLASRLDDAGRERALTEAGVR